jgi:hypothetical protein
MRARATLLPSPKARGAETHSAKSRWPRWHFGNQAAVPTALPTSEPI